jgi:hypothetical protein
MINKFRAVFLILVAERGRRKTWERRSFSTPFAGMLAVIRWISILRPFVEWLLVQSFI